MRFCRAPSNRSKLSAAQDFDAADVAGQQVGEVVAAAGGRWVVQLHAVDHHHGLVALGAANAHRGRAADPAVAREAYARRLSQQGRDVDRLAGANGVGVQDGDALADALGFLRRAVGGDDQFAYGGDGDRRGGLRRGMGGETA